MASEQPYSQTRHSHTILKLAYNTPDFGSSYISLLELDTDEHWFTQIKNKNQCLSVLSGEQKVR